MLENGKTVMKRWDSSEYVAVIAAIWEMGNWFCWNDSIPRKENKCALYHHCDRISDQMGRGTAYEIIYRGNKKNFSFEYALTRFGCSNLLMSDHGTHFLNEMISVLTEEFRFYH